MKGLKLDEHTGLVLEGGGMRGVFTCGVLDYLMDHDIRFEETVKVMKEYGYEIKQPKGGSSHYSFVKPGCSRIVIPRHKPIKKVYVKMIKTVIEEEMKEDESRTQLLHESVVSYGNC
jgi:predicted RNA binding protein YcfA (HicA-like mRNA interferase family)